MVKPSGYWTKEKVFEEARKYSTKSDFAHNCWTGYLIAQRNKWCNEMSWFIKKKYSKKQDWTKESIINLAKTCNTLKEFYRKSRIAYHIAEKNNWINEMDWFHNSTKGRKKIWCNAKIELEARKYSSKKEFSECNFSAYDQALRQNMINDLFPEKQHRKLVWTNEKLLEVSKKYKTRKELRINCYNAYNFMSKSKLLDKFYPERLYQKWTFEKMKSVSEKYSTRGELYKNDKNAYDAIRRNGLLDEFYKNN